MKINQTTTLAEIQTAFSHAFRYLRIEFYRTHHESGEGTSNREKIQVDQTVGEAGKITSSSNLDFDGSSLISAFEHLLEKEYGLHAQVFRRSGNLWLQTTTTDHWTLDEANRKGGHSKELFEEQHEE